jgi:transposase
MMTVKSSPNKLLRTLLGFKNLAVTGHEMLIRKGVLWLSVKPYKNGARCPHCGRPGKIVKRNRKQIARASRTWRDLPVGGLATAITYSPREITCDTHGRVQEDIPWAAKYSRTTYRFEFQMMRLCKVMTQKESAAQLGVPAPTLAEMLHRCVGRYRDGHKLRGLRSLGVDEISYRRGHRYLTIVYDLSRSHVVWVGEGKGRETIDRFFNEVMSAGQRARVGVACCDMSRTYIGAIEHHLPKALLVLDRFHVIKALNESVDEVRKEVWRAASKAERKELKGVRFIILKNKKNRTRHEHRVMAEMGRTQRQVARACELKDELSHFWTYLNPNNAEKFLKGWKKRIKLSRIEPLKKFAKTLEAHWDGVLASWTGVTNAVAEGLNRIIRMTKNRASGYRSTDNFANMIYLIVGDLDLPGRIGVINRPRITKPLHHKTLCR